MSSSINGKHPFRADMKKASLLCLYMHTILLKINQLTYIPM